MKSCDVGALTIEARVFHQPPRTHSCRHMPLYRLLT